MSQIQGHQCRNLYQPRTGGSVTPVWAEDFAVMLAIMPLAREVSLFDAEPAQAVRADVARFGVGASEPAGLLAFKIEKWLRLALRYVTEMPILLPLDTKKVWGRQIDSEEDFEFAVSDLHDIADRFLRACMSKYSSKAEARAFVASCRQSHVGTEGPMWDWNDEEDMVARIVNAPTMQGVEATEPPPASDQERAALRDHFGLGFNLTEIIDHLGLAPSIVFEEFAIWRREEQEEIERMEMQGGDEA